MRTLITLKESINQRINLCIRKKKCRDEKYLVLVVISVTANKIYLIVYFWVRKKDVPPQKKIIFYINRND